MILDVRTVEEYQAGHASDSVNIPLDVLIQKIQTENIPKDTSIVVCCESGGRSAYAVHVLEQLGFTHVVNGGSWRNIKK